MIERNLLNSSTKLKRLIEKQGKENTTITDAQRFTEEEMDAARSVSGTDLAEKAEYFLNEKKAGESMSHYYPDEQHHDNYKHE